MMSVEEAKQRLKDIEHHAWGESTQELAWYDGQQKILRYYISLSEDQRTGDPIPSDYVEYYVRKNAEDMDWAARGARDAIDFLDGVTDGEYHR